MKVFYIVLNEVVLVWGDSVKFGFWTLNCVWLT